MELALPRVMLHLKSNGNTEVLERNILGNLDTEGMFAGCLWIVPAAALLSGQRAALSSTSCSLHIICQPQQDKMLFHGMPVMLHFHRSVPVLQTYLLQFSLPAASVSSFHCLFPDDTLWFVSRKHCYCTPEMQPPNCCIPSSSTWAVGIR